MQINLDSGSFKQPGLVLRLEQAAARGRAARTRVEPGSALRRAQREARRAEVWEDLVWLGLALCALGLLLASFGA